jgi:hypothetical protein
VAGAAGPALPRGPNRIVAPVRLGPFRPRAGSARSRERWGSQCVAVRALWKFSTRVSAGEEAGVDG